MLQSLHTRQSASTSLELLVICKMSQLKEYKSQNEKIFAETGFFEKYDFGFRFSFTTSAGEDNCHALGAPGKFT